MPENENLSDKIESSTDDIAHSTPAQKDALEPEIPNHETKAELDESSSKRKHSSDEITNTPAVEGENKDEVTASEPTANEQPEKAQAPPTEESNSKEDDKSAAVTETAASSTAATSAHSRTEEPVPNTNAEKITSVQPPAKKKKFMGSSNSLSSSAKRYLHPQLSLL
ncbi:hypothetical protein AYI70_g11314 [Smittium culicis]|uniref:Uncharacterized protein n=1 Tax=Smittium culicis TaxID=133412 RepID=A0A1R1X2F5_9FUNG|nr:hypothetical protein AYI70_g11314 [Smittium culicis]